jgi:hypothetical protein
VSHFVYFLFFKEIGVGEHSATYPHLGPRSKSSWLAPSNANTSPFRVWGLKEGFKNATTWIGDFSLTFFLLRTLKGTN